MKLGAHAIKPFTANVTSAPPRNIQIRVGVRSTVAAAWRNSPNAVAATSVASVVRRTAAGMSRTTVHTIPALTNAANTAVGTAAGTRSNRFTTALAAAPASARRMSGAPYDTARRRPRRAQPCTVSRSGAGGR